MLNIFNQRFKNNKLVLPSELYQQKIDSGEIKADDKQSIILVSLDEVAHKIYHRDKQPLKFIQRLFTQADIIPGLYLWGGVGIGKTFLMDVFYQSLVTPKKMRKHFHQFMESVHQELNKYLGKKNPLELVAKQIAQIAGYYALMSSMLKM